MDDLDESERQAGSLDEEFAEWDDPEGYLAKKEDDLIWSWTNDYNANDNNANTDSVEGFLEGEYFGSLNEMVIISENIHIDFYLKCARGIP